MSLILLGLTHARHKNIVRITRYCILENTNLILKQDGDESKGKRKERFLNYVSLQEESDLSDSFTKETRQKSFHILDVDSI
jgi:hypothetical protein